MKTEMNDKNNETASSSSSSSSSSSQDRIAISNYRTIQTAPNSPYSLIEISLVTNYREQLRYQLACSGHAIVGDSIYTNKQYNKVKLVFINKILP
jgi:23S rRNA-/tRNA-specific pseudouridylate synthase